MQDLNDKITGGTLTADEWNEVPSELQNIIVATGQSLTSADLNQLGKGVADYASRSDFYNDTGTANNVVLTPIALFSPVGYNTGMRVRFQAGATNTGATTINVATIGSVNIVDQFDNALTAGAITTGIYYELVYNAAADGGAGGFVLEVASALTSELPANYITGCRTVRQAAQQINFAGGRCKSSDNAQDLVFGATVGKSINVNWAEGGTSGAPLGGFPSALTLTASTWYRTFLIVKPSGQVDAGFDTSPAAANLLSDAAGAGYNKYRQIGWVFYNGSNVIEPFTQDVENLSYFKWNTRASDVNETIPSLTAETRTLQAPPETYAELSSGITLGASATHYTRLDRVGSLTTAPSATNYDFAAINAANGGQFTILTNASSQIDYRVSQAGNTISIQTKGFHFYRGAL